MSAKFLGDSQKVVSFHSLFPIPASSSPLSGLQVTGSHDRTLKLWDIHHKTCETVVVAVRVCVCACVCAFVHVCVHVVTFVHFVRVSLCRCQDVVCWLQLQ